MELTIDDIDIDHVSGHMSIESILEIAGHHLEYANFMPTLKGIPGKHVVFISKPITIAVRHEESLALINALSDSSKNPIFWNKKTLSVLKKRKSPHETTVIRDQTEIALTNNTRSQVDTTSFIRALLLVKVKSVFVIKYGMKQPISTMYWLERVFTLRRQNGIRGDIIIDCGVSTRKNPEAFNFPKGDGVIHGYGDPNFPFYSFQGVDWNKKLYYTEVKKQETWDMTEDDVKMECKMMKWKVYPLAIHVLKKENNKRREFCDKKTKQASVTLLIKSSKNFIETIKKEPMYFSKLTGCRIEVSIGIKDFLSLNKCHKIVQHALLEWILPKLRFPRTLSLTEYFQNVTDWLKLTDIRRTAHGCSNSRISEEKIFISNSLLNALGIFKHEMISSFKNRDNMLSLLKSSCVPDHEEGVPTSLTNHLRNQGPEMEVDDSVFIPPSTENRMLLTNVFMKECFPDLYIADVNAVIHEMQQKLLITLHPNVDPCDYRNLISSPKLYIRMLSGNSIVGLNFMRNMVNPMEIISTVFKYYDINWSNHFSSLPETHYRVITVPETNPEPLAEPEPTLEPSRAGYESTISGDQRSLPNCSSILSHHTPSSNRTILRSKDESTVSSVSPWSSRDTPPNSRLPNSEEQCTLSNCSPILPHHTPLFNRTILRSKDESTVSSVSPWSSRDTLPNSGSLTVSREERSAKGLKKTINSVNEMRWNNKNNNYLQETFRKNLSIKSSDHREINEHTPPPRQGIIRCNTHLSANHSTSISSTSQYSKKNLKAKGLVNSSPTLDESLDFNLSNVLYASYDDKKMQETNKAKQFVRLAVARNHDPSRGPPLYLVRCEGSDKCLNEPRGNHDPNILIENLVKRYPLNWRKQALLLPEARSILNINVQNLPKYKPAESKSSSQSSTSLSKRYLESPNPQLINDQASSFQNALVQCLFISDMVKASIKKDSELKGSSFPNTIAQDTMDKMSMAIKTKTPITIDMIYMLAKQSLGVVRAPQSLFNWIVLNSGPNTKALFYYNSTRVVTCTDLECDDVNTSSSNEKYTLEIVVDSDQDTIRNLRTIDISKRINNGYYEKYSFCRIPSCNYRNITRTKRTFVKMTTMPSILHIKYSYYDLSVGYDLVPFSKMFKVVECIKTHALICSLLYTN